MQPGEIEREKKRLPRGWGRFGKALDHVAELAEPGEALLISCVGLGAAAAEADIPLLAAFGETNVMLAITDRRLIAIGTNLGGSPRSEAAIALADLQGFEVASEKKRNLRMIADGSELHVKSIAKGVFPEVIAVLRNVVREQTGRTADR
jgi:hypothetical protein